MSGASDTVSGISSVSLINRPMFSSLSIGKPCSSSPKPPPILRLITGSSSPTCPPSALGAKALPRLKSLVPPAVPAPKILRPDKPRPSNCCPVLGAPGKLVPVVLLAPVLKLGADP